jgi:hypothetical protein
MATLKLEIVAGGTTYTKTKTVTGPHLVRFIAAQRIVLGTPAGYTDTQVADAWFDKIYDQAKSETRSAEIGAAAAAVAPIDFT